MLLVSNVVGNALAHAAPGTIKIFWDDAALWVCNPRFPPDEAAAVGMTNNYRGLASIAHRVADRGLTVVITVTDYAFRGGTGGGDEQAGSADLSPV